MLRQLVEFGVIKLETESLDARIERRLKEFWEQTTCPRYVSPEGVHINQVECLFSVVKPWLRKFRGLSKHGLEQAAHTFGIVRSFNLVGASLEILVDSLAMGSLLSFE